MGAKKLPDQKAGEQCSIFLHTEQDPDQDVGRNDGSHGEGDADLEEVAVGNFVAFLAQDADAGDVGGSTDGGAVAAQGS